MKNLDRDVNELMSLQPTNAPVISCYVNPSTSHGFFDSPAAQRFRAGVKELDETRYRDFCRALGQVREHLALWPPKPGSTLALFCRAGSAPFFKAIEIPGFHTVSDRITWGDYPDVHPLTCAILGLDRVVALVSTPKQTQILEYSIADLVRRRQIHGMVFGTTPPLPPARIHYISRVAGHAHRLARESARRLRSVLEDRAKVGLVIYGQAGLHSRILSRLSDFVRSKLITNRGGFWGDDLMAWLHFQLNGVLAVQQDADFDPGNREWYLAKRMGMTAEGIGETLAALRRDKVDRVYLARDISPENGLMCGHCGEWTASKGAIRCSRCECAELRPADVKEAILNAVQSQFCDVVFQDHLGTHDRNLGVACLLRYRESELGGLPQSGPFIRQNPTQSADRLHGTAA